MRRSVPHMRRHVTASAATTFASIVAVMLLASPASAEATPPASATATVGTDGPKPQRSAADTNASVAPEPTDAPVPDPTDPLPEPDPTTPPPDPTTPPPGPEPSTPPPGPDPSTPPPDSPPAAEPTPPRPRPSNSPPRGGPQPAADTVDRSGGPNAAGADSGPSGPSLPVTGDRLPPIVGTAGAALIAGVGLLLAGRRRTR